MFEAELRFMAKSFPTEEWETKVQLGDLIATSKAPVDRLFHRVRVKAAGKAHSPALFPAVELSLVCDPNLNFKGLTRRDTLYELCTNKRSGRVDGILGNAAFTDFGGRLVQVAPTALKALHLQRAHNFLEETESLRADVDRAFAVTIETKLNFSTDAAAEQLVANVVAAVLVLPSLNWPTNAFAVAARALMHVKDTAMERLVREIQAKGTTGRTPQRLLGIEMEGRQKLRLLVDKLLRESVVSRAPPSAFQ